VTRAVTTTGSKMPTEIELSSGHTLTFDLGENSGGHGLGPTSTEGVSASLAACTVGTLRVYADRKGWDLEGLETTVDTTYDGPNPKLFEVTLGFPDHLDDEQVAKLLVIAGKCPVHRLLAEATEVQVKRG
jgi:putative redox protein